MGADSWSSEALFMADFQRHIGKRAGLRLWRQNAGLVKGYDEQGRRFAVKLAPEGAADLSGIAYPSGRRLDVEFKHLRTDKQTPAQRTWEKMIRTYGGIYVLLHSEMGLEGAEGVLLKAIT